ncbi:MAG: enoyl-CoA hydratase/isomerase family protein [candidate division NC10 bacterium]|nr:enoyl-CoA hydratase/isomerase family protein [candidate division NC10 bacterium]
MNQGAVLVEYDGPLARITLNRPEKLNAINLAWVQELDAAVSALAARPGVRVVVVRGAGRAFCAGLDLDMLAREGMPSGLYELQERAFHGLEVMGKITVAILHGYCLGGGLQLAIACDIRVCSTECRIDLPAINEGLVPGMAPFRLPRLIGLGPARRLILSGEVVGPGDALRLGLIDHLVPANTFEVDVTEILERYLAAPATAAVASKQLMRQAFHVPFERVYQASERLLADCLASPEVEAAKKAWRERQARQGESHRP